MGGLDPRWRFLRTYLSLLHVHSSKSIDILSSTTVSRSCVSFTRAASSSSFVSSSSKATKPRLSRSVFFPPRSTGFEKCPNRRWTSYSSQEPGSKTVLAATFVASALGIGAVSVWAYRSHLLGSGNGSRIEKAASPIARTSFLDAATALVGVEEDESEVYSENTRLSTSKKRLTWMGRCVQVYDDYVYEPIATTLRFLHLLCAFIPVILLVPIVWIGPRVSVRNHERKGTLWWYSILVYSMSRTGASFIKLGQWAASRTDLFPSELCKLMSSMHSDAPAHSISATRKVIESAFERPFEEVFAEFETEPLGVGAIAQVYKAVLRPGVNLKPSGDPTDVKIEPQLRTDGVVAVKVLHPRVRRTVERDLKIMMFFATLLDSVPTLEWFAFKDQVTQFGEMMRLQLNLGAEAANLHQFRKNFQYRKSACFPAEYSSSQHGDLLVEQYAHGLPLRLFLNNGAGVFHTQLAADGLNAFFSMLLIDNFVHADLHPGNILVRFVRTQKVGDKIWPDSWKSSEGTQSDAEAEHHSGDDPASPKGSADPTTIAIDRLHPTFNDPDAWQATLSSLEADGFRPQLIFIDTGLVTRLSEENLRNFIDLFRALAEFDGLKAGRLMVERSRTPNSVVDPDTFARGIDDLVKSIKSHTFALGNFGIGEMLSTAMALVRQHHVRLEGDFVNVILGMLLLEGIGRRLDPDLDILAHTLPILRKLGAQSRGKSDVTMLKVWAGLEARSWLRTAIDIVDRCVKSDLLAPNV